MTKPFCTDCNSFLDMQLNNQISGSSTLLVKTKTEASPRYLELSTANGDSTGTNKERKMKSEPYQSIILCLQAVGHGYVYCNITVTSVNVLSETRETLTYYIISCINIIHTHDIENSYLVDHNTPLDQNLVCHMHQWLPSSHHALPLHTDIRLDSGQQESVETQYSLVQNDLEMYLM